MIFLPDLSVGGHHETNEHKVDKGFDIPRMTSHADQVMSDEEMNFVESMVNSFGVSKLEETVLTTDSVPDPDEADFLDTRPY